MAAAGNELVKAVQYPAAYEEVVAVGVSSMKGEKDRAEGRAETHRGF